MARDSNERAQTLTRDHISIVRKICSGKCLFLLIHFVVTNIRTVFLLILSQKETSNLKLEKRHFLQKNCLSVSGPGLRNCPLQRPPGRVEYFWCPGPVAKELGQRARKVNVACASACSRIEGRRSGEPVLGESRVCPPTCLYSGSTCRRTAPAPKSARPASAASAEPFASCVLLSGTRWSLRTQVSWKTRTERAK